MNLARIIASAGVPLAVLGITAGCGANNTNVNASGQQELTTITFAQPTPKSMIFYPLIVGQELGYFEQEGVRVELAPASEEIPMTAFVTNGDADIAAAGASEVFFAIAEGQQIDVVYDSNHKSVEGTVVPADSEITSMADLKGKKVGLAAQENKAIFRAALKVAGVPHTAVETVIVGGGPTVANALQNGKIDAYNGAFSHWAAIEATGLKLRNITPKALAQLPGASFVALPKVMEAKHDALEGFMRAYAKATYVGFARPDVVEAIAREAVPAEWRKEDVAKALLKNVIDVHRPEGDLIGEVREKVWEASEQRLLNAEIIEEDIDLETVLNDTFIQAANDWDRGAVKQRANKWAEENL